MLIAFSAGTTLFAARYGAVTDISEMTVAAVTTVIKIYEIISRIKSTVFSNLFGNGRRILANVFGYFTKRHVIIQGFFNKNSVIQCKMLLVPGY